MSLEEFARTIMSIKPMLNNPDEFNKWLKNEEVEFEEPPIQEDMKEVSMSQLSSYYVRLITFYLMLYYFPPPGKIITLLPLIKWCFGTIRKTHDIKISRDVK